VDDARGTTLAALQKTGTFRPALDLARGWSPLAGTWQSDRNEILTTGGGERALLCDTFVSDGKGISLAADMKFESPVGNAGLLVGVSDPGDLCLLAVRSSTARNPNWTKLQLYQKVKGRYKATWPCPKAPETPVGEWFTVRLDWKDKALAAYVGDALMMHIAGVDEPAGAVGLRAGRGTRVRFRNVVVRRPENMPKTPTPPAPKP
jgi:hypothetical protein